MASDLPSKIFGGPTKRFFVSMLTRDINLDDAILDLIDNSIDGATRQLRGKVSQGMPYEGYWAKLNLSRNSFDISDNCGGIPQELIRDAFLLGRPKADRDKHIPTIGVYGIGMKRAIFKIGEEAAVESASEDGAFAVTYDREWMDPKNDSWNLPIETLPRRKTKGVTILVESIRPDIARQFGNEAFVNSLKNKIALHFGYLMQKGFAVIVNGDTVRKRTLQLHFLEISKNRDGIRPYDYEGVEDGVRVRVTVGFYRPLARIQEVDEEAETSGETDQAGISVVCNDRMVLENDKTIKTGWGDGGVPKYHPQFRGIAGFISFSTDTPERLPINTTKRDLEVGSQIYLLARQYCMEGLKIFTDFTNKWKGMESETSAFFEEAKKRDARTEIRLAAAHGKPLRGNPKAKKYVTRLPMPPKRNPLRRITFLRKEEEVKKVSLHLFNEADVTPSEVGEECFDRMLKAAKK
jgi:hypothetical protein